ncbi:unnamed protein product, partial [marine sediment metagenome]
MRLPVLAEGKKVFVVFSVDWEPNHGVWNHNKGTDYGGILKATPVLESLLDAQQVPCTWFVEVGKEADRDMPGAFPGDLRRLGRRMRDEIGLHVHWRHPDGLQGTTSYETGDRTWVQDQITHGVARLGSFGIRPTAFRSGALLFVSGLPGILEHTGFTTDSSTLWGKAKRTTDSNEGVRKTSTLGRMGWVVRRVLGSPPLPYFADPENVERTGCSSVLEFPIFSGLVESQRLVHSFVRHLTLWKARLGSSTTFLTLFFHIDELLDPRSGPNE